MLKSLLALLILSVTLAQDCRLFSVLHGKSLRDPNTLTTLKFDYATIVKMDPSPNGITCFMDLEKDFIIQSYDYPSTKLLL